MNRLTILILLIGYSRAIQEKYSQEIPPKSSSISADNSLETNVTNNNISPYKVQVIEDWLLGVQPSCLHSAIPSKQRNHNSGEALINSYKINNIKDEQVVEHASNISSATCCNEEFTQNSEYSSKYVTEQITVSKKAHAIVTGNKESYSDEIIENKLTENRQGSVKYISEHLTTPNEINARVTDLTEKSSKCCEDDSDSLDDPDYIPETDSSDESENNNVSTQVNTI